MAISAGRHLQTFRPSPWSIRVPWSGDPITMTATDVTGFCDFLSALKSGIFDTLGWSPYQFTPESWRNKENSSGENSKNPVGTVPRNCRFLSLVVIEPVLMKISMLVQGFWPMKMSGALAMVCAFLVADKSIYDLRLLGLHSSAF